MNNSKERFSDRVENYVKYRPSYPIPAVEYLLGVLGCGADSVVADIGAGTGIFCALLLGRVKTVYVVEPNSNMLDAAKAALSGTPGFVPLHAPAEATGLPDGSADGITAAQAFHWFDPSGAKKEFARILKPGRRVGLIWNWRITDSGDFSRAYDELVPKYSKDYKEVNHHRLNDGDFRAFFRNGVYDRKDFPNSQYFDFEGIKGRLLSASYAPNPGQPGHEEMIAELMELFGKHNSGGRVEMRYRTEVYTGEV
ncbi:MAG: hypothetical protein A2Y33_03225 [Spirochaetes bacterium GWF1_51_8]|nr:MAG: hypothetical protein A2Y33_03225 [Spirochaetes bacterium GWF1_51_8]